MKIKSLVAFGALVVFSSIYLYAADHIEAPGVSGTTSDITDYYAFESPESSSNIVLVANLQGLLSPSATASAKFDENVMVEFNIDTNDDKVEDLVVQCSFADGKMTVYGPIAPSQTGTTSSLETDASSVSVNVSTYGQSPVIATANGVKAFAGPRDDPFFMDFSQFGEILAGNATGFNDPGTDTFAGTNVMSVVVEVPKSQIGGSGTINTWVTSNRKQ
jgi:hypothetical protein|tara:strand:- start:935 stop:1588 length:654 start_codon:yes stop_codon:yes gene_type:complete